jgi:hypothetical protein
MQQFGRDRVESRHHADIVERPKMTHADGSYRDYPIFFGCN